MGAVITHIIVPDRDGVFEDIVLGYDTVPGFEENKPAFGAVIGRVANRIANACFELMAKNIHWIRMMLQTVCMAGCSVMSIVCTRQNVPKRRMRAVFHLPD